MTAEILRMLTEYALTRKEFDFCDRHDGQKDWTGFHDRWKAAKTKLSQLSFPDRATVEAACAQELQHLASEAPRLLEEWRRAIQAELEALKIWRAAEATLEYAQQYPILALDTQTTRQAEKEARAAFEAASRKRNDNEMGRRRISDYITEEYPGSDLKRPETFEVAARGRVERVLGAYYQPEPAAQRWG
jgi:hypothetical protein